MDCTECGNDVVLVKKTKVNYNGIRVENVYLRNCEVEVCRHCGTELPVVRNIRKVHRMIGLGIALQPAKLTGDEVRFLRKVIRLTAAEWAARIGIAPETFSRWENGRSPAQQVEKLARIDLLMAISKELSLDFIQDGILEVLTADLTEGRDFALMIDAENLDARPQYESLRSIEFAAPSISSVAAMTFDWTRQATVTVLGGVKSSNPRLGYQQIKGETCDAGNALLAAA